MSATALEQRQFQLSLASTTYNYMRSYLEPIPMSADLPKGEEFSIAYEAKVLQAFVPIAENFKKVVMGLLTKELQGDLPTQALAQIEQAHAKLSSNLSVWHPEQDLASLKGFIDSLADLPKSLEGLVRIPKDLEKMANGLAAAFDGFIKDGPTAFLKSTLFDMLSADHGRDYLQAATGRFAVHDVV